MLPVLSIQSSAGKTWHAARHSSLSFVEVAAAIIRLCFQLLGPGLINGYLLHCRLMAVAIGTTCPSLTDATDRFSEPVSAQQKALLGITAKSSLDCPTHNLEVSWTLNLAGLEMALTC